MRIVARIQKVGCEQYLFEGKVFDSFLSARREMTERIRARRNERQEMRARLPLSRLQTIGA